MTQDWSVSVSCCSCPPTQARTERFLEGVFGAFSQFCRGLEAARRNFNERLQAASNGARAALGEVSQAVDVAYNAITSSAQELHRLDGQLHLTDTQIEASRRHLVDAHGADFDGYDAAVHTVRLARADFKPDDATPSPSPSSSSSSAPTSPTNSVNASNLRLRWKSNNRLMKKQGRSVGQSISIGSVSE